VLVLENETLFSFQIQIAGKYRIPVDMNLENDFPDNLRRKIPPERYTNHCSGLALNAADEKA
jgi:hypothetical protein